MTRIFATLASLSLGVYAAAVIVGLGIGNLYDHPDAATLEWRGVHMLTGTGAALAVVLIHSIVVTYFIGTSRWCKEVVETYQLDPEDAADSARLKRQTFPWCVAGMLTVVLVGALGAASDPGTGRPNTQAVADYHLAMAWAGLAVVAWTYFQAWTHILANQAVINRIVSKVQAIRAERGLDDGPSPEALETADSTGA